MVVTLQGMVKGESNDRDHLLPCIKVTTSGVDVKASLATQTQWGDDIIQSSEAGNPDVIFMFLTNKPE